MKHRILMLFLCIFTYLSTSNAQFTNNPSAETVLGQADFVSYASGTSASKFNGPMGVAIDTVKGKVFVSDRYNNRILRFSSTNAYINGGSAEAVLGQTDFTTNTAASTPTASSLNNPIGITIDKAGRLWVADFNNNRILRYDSASDKASGAAADGVLGQSNFTTKTSGVTQSAINGPVGIFIDDNDNLWVADFNNNRILKFANASTKANGANADVVLGQTGFTTKTTGITASAMNAPNGVYIDISGNLWVSDRVNYRFLRFDNASAKSSGANADGVLGQPNFTTNTSNITINGSGYARFVWGDKNGRIYCMQENHRITVFDNAAGKPNGANADGVIGQADFTSNASPQPPTASSLKDPKGMFVNNSNGDVWVTDASNHRVLRYTFNKPITIPITITAPDGGEEWGRNSVQTISWVSNYNGKVKLEYSTNAGQNWTYIDTAKTSVGSCSYIWAVPNTPSLNSLIKISDFSNNTISDVSNNPFLISDKVIVVVGSSTAAGQGPVNVDSAWVWRYRRYVKTLNPTASVINLAVGGYSTYECMPTGFVPPAGKATPHTNANITKALSYSPDAIIVNLPTNDAYWNYTLTETLNNFATIVSEAKSKNIPIWVTTSQGRNLSQSGRDLLIATRDSILSIYKNNAIDFWTGLSGGDGYILSQYNSGDGVHMNSDAHKILCQRVIDAHVLESVLLSEFSMSPKKLSFGGVITKQSKIDSITVTNTGDSVLSVDSVKSDNTLFTVTPKNATVNPGASTKFFVSFAPIADGAQSGRVFFYHNASNKQDTALVSGTAAAKSFFTEDFTSTSGTVLTSAGWILSGTNNTNPLTVTSSGLTFDNYVGTALGNAVALQNNGQDVYASFPALNTGSVYLAFMLNVSAVGTGDYFIALSPTSSQTNYYARLHIKSSTNGYLLGISKNNEVSGGAKYGTTELALNKTNLVVVKYTFMPQDTANDTISVYAFPTTTPQTEPSTAEIAAYTTNTKTDASDLGYVTLRQGSTGAAPALTIDGLRIQSKWDFTLVAPDTTQLVSIATAREDLNSDFVPDRKGQTLKVTGIVISPDFTKSASGNNYYISDGNAGILVYSSKKLSSTLNIGDSVLVKGKVDQYKGVTEFVPVDTLVGTTGSVTVLKSGATVPAPKVITVKELNSEKYEGCLVTVKGLSKTPSSPLWPAVDKNVALRVQAGSDSTLLFIDLDTDIDGSTEPVWPQDVTGIATQNATAANNDNYEIMPRSTADFKKTSGVSDVSKRIPTEYALDQNYPNPFNPSTVISFDLRTNANVTLKVYSIIGQEVAVVLNGGQMSAGHQSAKFNASNLPSGIYLYRLEVKGNDGSHFTSVRKMMLLK